MRAGGHAQASRCAQRGVLSWAMISADRQPEKLGLGVVLFQNLAEQMQFLSGDSQLRTFICYCFTTVA